MEALRMLLDAALAVAMVACAGVALWTRREPRAVGWYVAFGTALAMASARLGAVDVAVAKVLVGAGATGWLLWRVVSRTEAVDTESPAAAG